jgi:hypothetical protein
MILEAAIDVFMLPQDVKESEGDNLEQLDPEETSFQASFSKLGASEPQFRDPLSAVPDAKRYLAAELAATSARHPGKVRSDILIASARSLIVRDIRVAASGVDAAIAPGNSPSFHELYDRQWVSCFA